MTAESMRSLLFSLAWYPHSNYHHNSVVELLRNEFPDADFSDSLNEFLKICESPPCEGSPK